MTKFFAKFPKKDKFALVTGASAGIGRAIAIELGRLGLTVGLIARRKEDLEETKKLVEQAGGKGEVLVADLSLPESIKSLVSRIKFPRVNFLTNVAGIWHGKDQVYADRRLEEMPERVILDTFSVGVMAPMLLARAVLPKMPKGSKIINISGTFESGGAGWLPYYVSKRAIEDFTVGLAQECRERD